MFLIQKYYIKERYYYGMITLFFKDICMGEGPDASVSFTIPCKPYPVICNAHPTCVDLT